jgi:uncharacterized protein YaiL (DUF2058 family)
MWDMKCFVIPVIIGATGIVIKGLKISGNNTKKAFYRFSTKEHITRIEASATIYNLKPECLGASLVQEKKYQGKRNVR